MRVYQVRSSDEFGDPDLVIIPGTKNTVHDLEWLKKKGLDKEILRLRRSHVPIIGICGGYQILGKKLADPFGIEGATAGEYEGLGLLHVETKFSSYTKKTRRVTAEVLGAGPILGQAGGKEVRAYEIHMGETRLGAGEPPFRILSGNGRRRQPRYDGAISNDGLVFGSYLHGLFDDGTITRALLRYLALKKRGKIVAARNKETSIEKTWKDSLDLFCNTLCSSVDINRILEIAQIKPQNIRAPWKSSK
jgi:adenosylcobyric acid synthase